MSSTPDPELPCTAADPTPAVRVWPDPSSSSTEVSMNAVSLVVESPSLDSLVEEVGRQLEAWITVDGRVRRVHARLAELPGGDEHASAELLDHTAQLHRAATSLGMAIGRWRALGGRIELVDPPAPDDDSDDDASCAPVVSAPPTVDLTPTQALSAPAEAPAPEGVAPALREAASPLKAPKHRRAGPEQLAKLQRLGIGGARRQGEEGLNQLAVAHRDALVGLVRVPLAQERLQPVAAWLRHVDLIDALPDLAARTLIVALTARLRALAVRRPAVSLEPLLRPLREWVTRRKPGFVHGLSHAHTPTHATWDDDADAAVAELFPRPTLALAAPLPGVHPHAPRERGAGHEQRRPEARHRRSA